VNWQRAFERIDAGSITAADVAVSSTNCQIQVLTRANYAVDLKILAIDGGSISERPFAVASLTAPILAVARNGSLAIATDTTLGAVLSVSLDGGAFASPILPSGHFVDAVTFSQTNPSYLTLHGRQLANYSRVYLDSSLTNPVGTQSACAGVLISRATVASNDVQVLVGSHGMTTCGMYGAMDSSSNDTFLAAGRSALGNSTVGVIVPLGGSAQPALLGVNGSTVYVSVFTGTELDVDQFTLNQATNPIQLSSATVLVSMTGATAAAELVATPDGFFLIGEYSSALYVNSIQVLPLPPTHAWFVIRFDAAGGVSWVTHFQANEVPRKAILLDDQLLIAGYCVTPGPPRCPSAYATWVMSLAP
jgi:hypothetical protein